MKRILPILILLIIILAGCSKPIEEANYDIIVVGTDPEGIAAAIASARAGKSTLLIDSRDEVGGLFTLGWLNYLDMNYDENKTLLTRGIFKEFFDQVEGISFDIATAKKVFNNMIQKEKNIKLILNAKDITPIVENNSIKGITAKVAKKDYQFNSKQVIDSTQDGDIAAKANAPHTLGQEDIGGPTYGMAVTQVFKLGGVKIEDWTRLDDHLNGDNDPNSGLSGYCAWGFARFFTDYKPIQDNMQLRGLNIARQRDGCVMINALQIFQIDPLNPDDIQLAKDKALKELENIIPFLKKEVPGFENIQLLSVAPELYVRESRHFETEYVLTLDDVLGNKNFPDKIAMGSYPVDLQGTKPGADVIIIGNPQKYSIPYGSIVPKEIDNLLIASRAAGYTSLAHGSARMVPVGMCLAEAAGNAAAMAIDKEITVREISYSSALIHELQQKLIKNGAYLPDFNGEDPLLASVYYEGIKLLRNYGLIQGRYNNNYKLEDRVTVGEYSHALSVLNKNLAWGLELVNNESPSTDYLNTKDITQRIQSNLHLVEVLSNNEFFKNLEKHNFVTREEMANIFYLINKIKVK